MEGKNYIIAISICAFFIIVSAGVFSKDNQTADAHQFDKQGAVLAETLADTLILTEIKPLERDFCSLAYISCSNDKTLSRANESDKKASQTQNVEQIIRVVAEQEGIDPDLMVRIAWAESGLNPKARGKITPEDRGIFQINSYFNPDVSDECSFDPWCASRWTAKEINEGRLWKWSASKHKWSK